MKDLHAMQKLVITKQKYVIIVLVCSICYALVYKEYSLITQAQNPSELCHLWQLHYLTISH